MATRQVEMIIVHGASSPLTLHSGLAASPLLARTFAGSLRVISAGVLHSILSTLSLSGRLRVLLQGLGVPVRGLIPEFLQSRVLQVHG
jgi:hypothetical protein